MSALLKVLGWTDLGVFPRVGLANYSIVWLADNSGLVLHEWDNAGHFGISFFDGTTLKYTGQASFTGNAIGNNYTQMPVQGHILRANGLYVFERNDGSLWSCFSPDSKLFGTGNNGFQSVVPKGNNLYVPEFGGYNPIRYGGLFFHKKYAGRFFIQGFFETNQYVAVMGFRDLQLPDTVYYYPGRLVAGKAFNLGPGYGPVGGNPYHGFLPGSIYDNLNNRVINPEAALPYAPSVFNNPYLGKFPAALCDGDTNPPSAFYNANSLADYWSGNNDGYELSNFDNNIWAYYQSINTQQNNDISDKYVYYRAGNMAQILYYDRQNRFAFPIVTPLPNDTNGNPVTSQMSCAGQMLVGGGPQFGLYVLSIQYSDMVAYNTTNMSRLRSE